jgi:hypothetical protein
MNEKKSRKLRNRELEAKKRQRAKIASMVFIAVAALMVAGIALAVVDVRARSWVLRFDGARIHTNELRTFMTQNPTESQRQFALDFLIERLVVLERVERYGLGFDENEMAFWEMWIGMEWGSSAFMSDARQANLLHTTPGGELWERLAQHYFPDSMVFIDEYQFDIDVAEYLAANRHRYATVEVLSAYMETMDDAFEARDRIMAGEMTFEDLLRQLHEEFSDASESEVEEFEMPEPESLHRLIEMYAMSDLPLTEEDIDMLFATQLGEVSGVVNWAAAWGMEMPLMTYVVSREEPDDNDVIGNFRAQRINEARNEMMVSLVEGWVSAAAADIRINQRAVNRA